MEASSQLLKVNKTPPPITVPVPDFPTSRLPELESRDSSTSPVPTPHSPIRHPRHYYYYCSPHSPCFSTPFIPAKPARVSSNLNLVSHPYRTSPDLTQARRSSGALIACAATSDSLDNHMIILISFEHDT